MTSLHRPSLDSIVCWVTGIAYTIFIVHHPYSGIEDPYTPSCLRLLSTLFTPGKASNSTLTIKAIVDITLRPRSPVRYLLSLYTTTKSNSVAQPGEYVGNFDYLLQHGAHVVSANATCHVAHNVKA